MLLTLDLVPGLGVGEFTLGMPLAKAVDHVRCHKEDFRCVELKYADQALLEHDIILNFPEHGMHLRFESKSQRLRLIEVYDVSRMQLRYGKGLLGGASHAATALLVYELLGPTVPGSFDAAAREYPLHYPGVLFLFPIPPQHLEHCRAHAAELPLEFPDDTTPVASRICVHTGTAGSPAEVIQARPPQLPRGDEQCQTVEAVPRLGLHFCGAGQWVRFGDSPQDVCSELGCPSSTATKDGVHSAPGSRRCWEACPADYFYCYADRGVDVLFDGESHRVKKLVLHSNAPGHADFTAHSKCHFRLQLRPQDPALEDEEPNRSTDEESYEQHSFSDSGSASAAAQPSLQDGDSAGQAGSRSADGRWAPSRQPATLQSPDSAASKGLIQNFLEDFVKSPVAADKERREGPREDDGQLQWEWGGAANWTKSLIDIGSDALNSIGGAPEAEGHPAHIRPASATARLEHERRPHTPDAVPGCMPEEERQLPDGGCGDAGSQDDGRDGWDDLDVAMLGMDLGGAQSEGQVLRAVDDSVGQEQPKPPGSPVARDSRVPCSSSVQEGSCDSQPSDKQERCEQQKPEAAAEVQITADSRLEDIRQVMGEAGLATVHTRGMGPNPFGRTRVFGYEGVAFEVMRNGYIASMTLFQAS